MKWPHPVAALQRLMTQGIRLFGAVPLRSLLIFTGIALILMGTLIWFNPSPPKVLHLGIGKGYGLNSELALQYQALLKKDGIRLELVKTEGSIDSLQQLASPAAKIDVAFVLGGVAHEAQMAGLVALGSLYYEPIWVFYRAALGHDLTVDELADRRISIGSATSGSYINAVRILETYGLSDGSARFEMMSGQDALQALREGRLDAAFLAAPPESKRLREFFAEPRLRLIATRDNRAIAARLPYLQSIRVPRGSVDLAQHFPATDTDVLGTTMTLVARENLHPALVYRLMAAVKTVNGGPGLLHAEGAFPSKLGLDFPLSTSAGRFYQSGVPFLQSYFPFWIANLLDRFLLIILPVLAMLFPLLRVAPAVYGWSMRNRLSRWYARLLQLEADLNRGELCESRSALERLDAIERGVREIRLPLAFSSQLYVLREHIDLVRRGISEGRWFTS